MKLDFRFINFQHSKVLLGIKVDGFEIIVPFRGKFMKYGVNDFFACLFFFWRIPIRIWKHKLRLNWIKNNFLFFLQKDLDLEELQRRKRDSHKMPNWPSMYHFFQKIYRQHQFFFKNNKLQLCVSFHDC